MRPYCSKQQVGHVSLVRLQNEDEAQMGPRSPCFGSTCEEGKPRDVVVESGEEAGWAEALKVEHTN